MKAIATRRAKSSIAKSFNQNAGEYFVVLVRLGEITSTALSNSARVAPLAGKYSAG
jgi:hypothetical protein